MFESVYDDYIILKYIRVWDEIKMSFIKGI